ncbi:MAG: hypothetical protein ABJN22_11330 [Litorimonas sp.]
MTSISSRSLRVSSLILTISALTLSACATKPDRERPPRDGERQDRPARNSGTFVQPAALLFADMDSNQDKVTSQAEMLTGVQNEWESFDRNPSATAFSNWSLKALGSTDANPTFMSFDRDFNGVITKSEFTAQFDRLFKIFDKNADGLLDRAEMIVAYQAPMGRAQRGGESGQRGGRGGGRPPR